MLFTGLNSGCLGNMAARQYVLGGQHEWSQDSMKVKITSWTESFSCRSYEPCLAAHWRLRENNWHKLTDMILLSPSKHWYRVHGNFLQWPSSEGAMLPTVKYWGQEWRRTSTEKVHALLDTSHTGSNPPQQLFREYFLISWDTKTVVRQKRDIVKSRDWQGLF